MNKPCHALFTACALLSVLTTTAAHGADAVIASPDGRAAIHVAGDGATFSVTRQGETVAAYRGEPGFDFIRRVPTAWDETRFLAGEPGRDIVLARRLARTWYLGAMAADGARTERVPLRFLPPGRYRASVWQDGETARELRRSVRTVAAADVLVLPLAAAGGAAVILEPLP